MLSASSDQFEINEQQFIRFLLLFPDGQTTKKADSSLMRLINKHCKSQPSSPCDRADSPAGTGLLSSADASREQRHNQRRCVPHTWEGSDAILLRALRGWEREAHRGSLRLPARQEIVALLFHTSTPSELWKTPDFMVLVRAAELLQAVPVSVLIVIAQFYIK